MPYFSLGGLIPKFFWQKFVRQVSLDTSWRFQSVYCLYRIIHIPRQFIVRFIQHDWFSVIPCIHSITKPTSLVDKIKNYNKIPTSFYTLSSERVQLQAAIKTTRSESMTRVSGYIIVGEIIDLLRFHLVALSCWTEYTEQ